MLEFALAMSASVPFARIHWYVYVGLVSPLASVMPVVAAVSVSPTCAVPVMVGAPIAAVLAPRQRTPASSTCRPPPLQLWSPTAGPPSRGQSNRSSSSPAHCRLSSHVLVPLAAPPKCEFQNTRSAPAKPICVQATCPSPLLQ